MRSTREELIKKGVIKERTEETIEEENQSVNVETSPADQSHNASGGHDHEEEPVSESGKFCTG